MPIPLPNLDDQTYTELVAEGQALIPTVYPTWTNHNPSDPGMVLVELLAWLTEMTLFQVNEITVEHIKAFLELLNGPDLQLDNATFNGVTNGNLDAAVRQTMLGLRERYRAVTCEDYEHLLLDVWPKSQAAATAAEGGGQEPLGEIARVRCLPNCDLETNATTIEAPGHVSMVVLPKGGTTPTDTFLKALWVFLDERRQLTVQHHVVAPSFVPIKIEARVLIHEDVLLKDAVDQLDGPERGLVTYFNSHRGGIDGTGWPFGRGVYASEIYAILSRLPVVDYVENVRLLAEGNEPSTVSIELDKHQLVQIDLSGIVVVDALGNEMKVPVKK